MEIINHTLNGLITKNLYLCLYLTQEIDSVPFVAIIIIKLKRYGISEITCRIITPYLPNGKQNVSVKDSISYVREFSIGVPKSSFYFTIIIINDLRQTFRRLFVV